MDNSRNYIEMYEKAKEIQSLRKPKGETDLGWKRLGKRKKIILCCEDCGWEGTIKELINGCCPNCGYSGIEEKE